MSDVFDKCAAWKDYKIAKATGLYPYYRAIEASHGSTEVEIQGRRMIMVGSNNYLGLASDPRVQEAALALGLALQIVEASSERDFETVFHMVVSQQDGVLIVAPDAFFLSQRVQIADLATRYRVPTMYEFREFVEVGGLISYGASAVDLYRQGGTLTGQILMGKKPADLPVLQPTRFDLTINMKTARALGLTISSGLLSIADELIE